MLLKDEEWSQRSDRWIAETAGVHHVTVANLKASTGEIHQLNKGCVLPVAGKDGKKRKAKKITLPSHFKTGRPARCETARPYY